METAPYVIGIAGPSGAGKSALTRCLCRRLPAPAAILPMDAYYHDLAGLPTAARATANFDHPEALDHRLLAQHLGCLARGVGVARPVYEFATHTRAARAEPVAPAPFVVVEGLLALYWEEIRARIRTAVYVELSDAACLERRLARDTLERGRSASSIRDQYRRTVRPMREQFVQPTRAFAHVIVSGADPLEVSAERVLAHLAGPGRG